MDGMGDWREGGNEVMLKHGRASTEGDQPCSCRVGDGDKEIRK